MIRPCVNNNKYSDCSCTRIKHINVVPTSTSVFRWFVHLWVLLVSFIIINYYFEYIFFVHHCTADVISNQLGPYLHRNYIYSVRPPVVSRRQHITARRITLLFCRLYRRAVHKLFFLCNSLDLSWNSCRPVVCVCVCVFMFHRKRRGRGAFVITHDKCINNARVTFWACHRLSWAHNIIIVVNYSRTYDFIIYSTRFVTGVRRRRRRRKIIIIRETPNTYICSIVYKYYHRYTSI